VGAALYLVIGRAIVLHVPDRARDPLFATLNVAGVYALFFPFGHLVPLAVFLCYVCLAVLQFGVLRLGGASIAAFLTPVAVLVAIKALIATLPESAMLPGDRPILPMLVAIVGFSYFAFRTSYLALEVRNGRAAPPTLSQYLGFAFFVPTMAAGPINRYGSFRASISSRGAQPAIPLQTAAMRLFVGLVKYRFVAGVLDQLTYAGLMLDGHPHHWMDLVIASVAYYLFLYFNFSGFCDMAIGAAGIMGIAVEENFDNPFAARNVRDFWNRWHITLSVYMRDVVFTPTSKYLTGLLGIRAANHAAAVAIALVFVLIGVWHGLAWNYIAFGVMHAVGVVVTHYWTIALKRMGRERFQAYNASRVIHAAAVAITFVFATASFFLFANSFADIAEILAAARSS
jgi:D-alanyl-lipoteichoic acid acyltransferase DltB (MBOAT superfamily)